jgi:hypothetical protein
MPAREIRSLEKQLNFCQGVGVFGLPLRIFDFPGDHSHDIYGESFPRRVIPFFITSSEPQVGQIR